MKEWKEIPHCNYLASSDGELKHKVTGHIASPRLNPHTGYYQYTLAFRGKTNSTQSVHILITLAFLGEKPHPKMMVNHKNGIKTDNRVENLEYCTRSENAKHAVKMGLMPPPVVHKGEDHPKAKLTDDIVRHIRTCDLSLRQLADMYKVDHGLVGCVRRGEIWKHVQIS